LEARALLELGMLLRARGEPEGAVDVLKRATLLAQRLGHARLEMMAIGARASNERMLGRPLEAEILVRQALAAADALADRENAAHLRGNLANLCLADGRVAEALRMCREARAHYRAHGHVRSEAFLLLTMGIGELLQGHLDEARTQLLASGDSFAVSGVPVGEGCAWANLGRLRHHTGDPVAAIDAYTRALAHLGGHRPGLVARVRALRALALLDAGSADEATAMLADLDAEEPLVALALRGVASPSPDAFGEEVRALLGSHRLERDYQWR
ncbi:MAG: hypothetical protein AAF211_20005, partial [Myxococcota bacterium]